MDVCDWVKDTLKDIHDKHNKHDKQLKWSVSCNDLCIDYWLEGSRENTFYIQIVNLNFYRLWDKW